MAEFQPRELDELEDALELLEDLDELESLELSPALTGRLSEYQDVLALCREAFPQEEPSETALLDVLAEAREVSRPSLGVEEGAVGEGPWRRFWERWRGTLLPAAALAGTAAAVLWMLEPQRESTDDLLTEDAAKLADADADADADGVEERPASKAEERSAEPASSAVEPIGESEGAAGSKGEDAGASEAAAASEDDASSGAATLDSDSDDGGDEKVEAKANERRPSTKSKAVAELPAEPAPTPLSKNEAWDLLTEADRARLSGRCTRANELYKRVISASAISQAVAQAKAGVGLCLEQQDRDAEAQTWYDEARADNPAVQAWIDTQRDEQPLPSKSGKSRSKKSAAPDLEDAL
ncbi:hypothetical protein G6O69_09750 [Pseudenhygromyxa sp. WMMC2535]|uniref:hypothetical protein n=1 Tax=Pseudenhygromyxa sp. WMMC2535 TaxID=2712867 RepID=UPI0015581010|nr:hypothetical protein [Pseudenhygromyxa sp. WMMC2535]NVB38115.1 hypothetical protein [Pseudenhygromyxa sp. WMMC2535]